MKGNCLDIFNLAKSLIDDGNHFVVHVEEQGKNRFLLLVDAFKGVHIEDCAKWNLCLRELIEKNISSLVHGDFDLVVSSYGIGRPLKDDRQYLINKGRKVVVKYMNHEELPEQIEGFLKEVEPDSIEVETKHKKQTQFLKIKKQNIQQIHTEVVF